MVAHSLFWTHFLIAIVMGLFTSGVWLTAYFVAVKPNIRENCDPSIEFCTIPGMPKCAETCEFLICESIPNGLNFNSSLPVFNSTTDCWMRLMLEAEEEIIIGSYYWSLLVEDTGDGFTTDPTNSSFNGKLIYDTLLSTAVERNISIRIAQNYEEGGYTETKNLEKESNGKIQVRSLNFKNWYPGGILHTKSWSVDGKHFYIGSANFDWRSLTQVKELGIAAFNCPCIGNDLKKLLELYWIMGSPGAQIPTRWDNRYATPANHQSPMSVYQPAGNEAVYISASPPGFQACGREDDLMAMIKSIDESEDFVYLAVMDYSPSTIYMGNSNKWKPELDNAIRRAAFERAVKIRFMISLWPYTQDDVFGFMYSLRDISDNLPCFKYNNSTCVRKGSIEVRFIEVPTLQYGNIPYARVYHNKYFVTEKTAYIGTSNWSSDYWEYTAGIGIVIRADDSSVKSNLVQKFTTIFERDWFSSYTIPLSNFTIHGKKN